MSLSPHTLNSNLQFQRPLPFYQISPTWRRETRAGKLCKIFQNISKMSKKYLKNISKIFKNTSPFLSNFSHLKKRNTSGQALQKFPRNFQAEILHFSDHSSISVLKISPIVIQSSFKKEPQRKVDKVDWLQKIICQLFLDHLQKNICQLFFLQNSEYFWF